MQGAACVGDRRAIAHRFGGGARGARQEAELERTFVRAPFAGRVIDVLRRPGEIVGVDGILELARIDQMQAIAEVFETDVRRVRSRPTRTGAQPGVARRTWPAP